MDSNNDCVVLVDVSYYEKFSANAVWRSLKDEEGFPDSDPEFDPMSNDAFSACYRRYFDFYLDSTVAKYYPMRSQSSYVFCMDCRRSDIWRRSVHPGYKHNRDVAVHKFSWSSIAEWTESWAKSHSETYGSKFIKVSGAEADDIIAVISRKYYGNELIDVVIVSGDSDLLQLGGPNIIQIDSKGEQMTILKRIEKDGVLFDPTPMNYLKYKIMTGDSTDCISSIRHGKCGPKTASMMVNSPEKMKQYIKSDKSISSNFIMNTILIDLRKTPGQLIESIEDQYGR